MHPAAATLYTPIYFAKPAAEPEPLRQSIERFSPVVAGGGADWVSSLDGCEALVADLSGCDATVGAEVVYALHTRRIPVLCLRRAGASELPAIEALAHPLLTCSVYAGAAEAALAVERFLTPPAQPGRIFVVEGGDGAGKQTQTAMLRARLEGLGYPVSSIDFPHDAAMHGRLIRTLLSGAKGGIKAVNPLLFASLYSQNRFDVTPLLTHWLRRGDNVILDRYVEANFGHQASKLPAGERPALIEALATFEHEWLAIPRAHRVTYLDLPPRDALASLSSDGTRAALDMHETAGAEYKNGVRETYLWCSHHFEHWKRLPCLAEDGSRISKEKLNDMLFASLEAEFVNRKDA